MLDCKGNLLKLNCLFAFWCVKYYACQFTSLHIWKIKMQFTTTLILVEQPKISWFPIETCVIHTSKTTKQQLPTLAEARMNRWALQCALLMVSQQLASQCFRLNYTDASQGCRKESKCLSLLVFGAVICCHPSLSHVLGQSPCLIWIGWAPVFVSQTCRSGHLLTDCQSDKSIIHCYHFL